LGLDDWRINEQSAAVLQPLAEWTQLMQGTLYPTLPLVLPTVYNLIETCESSSVLSCSFSGADPYELQPDEMHSGVLEARTALHDDLFRRWITKLPPETKKVYAIATLLHPCFKDYSFIDEYAFVSAADKPWALSELRNEWRINWKNKPLRMPAPEVAAAPAPASPAPAATATPTTTAPAPTPAAPITKPSAHGVKSVSLGSLLGKRKPPAAPAPAAPECDELEEYLSAPMETDQDIDVLAWWKLKERQWPKLVKMVRQYFAAPASSAGVERVFSAAGKMHNDLRKAMKDTSLEHSLFAAYNTEEAPG